MTVQTRAAAVPELLERFVRRSLWLLGGAAVLLYVLWSASDMFAPWRTMAFLRTAGFRAVSYDAARDATSRQASFTPLEVAAVEFFLSAAVVVAIARTSRGTERDMRRATVAMVAGMTLAVGGYAANQIRTAGDAGRRLDKLTRVTQSSVDGIAGSAGVQVNVLANMDFGLAGQRVHLSGPVLAVGGMRFSSSDTVFGYDTASGRAFSSPSSAFAYSGGPG
ncbi:hypothetical protein [Catenulispora rubra]|uniref:hypothetical protein n=1 Tax=Catenulispora rubra TaxID=280293 RepID=UPI00189223F0|nr:hypothetical protein [Catenulispora rubra]